MAVTDARRPRAAAAARELDPARTGPGTLAGRYWRRFWHPVYRAADLAAGDATPIRILGEDFTLYRGEGGAVHVLAYRCAHRGTLLGAGSVEDDCLRCLYHGWKYAADGQCVEQPAEAADFARKVRIRAYPTEEYLGLIFVWLGEGVPPVLPRYPEFAAREGVHEVLRPQVWACNYLQRLDNTGDPAHLPFTHARHHLSGRERAGVPEFSRAESAWGATLTAIFPGGAYNVLQFGMPNVHWFAVPSLEPEAAYNEHLQWLVPIDDEHSTEFSLRVVPVTGEAAARLRARREQELATEGQRVAELGEAIIAGQLKLRELAQMPQLTPRDVASVQDYVAQVGQGRMADRRGERLGRSDAGVILLRKLYERELRALAAGQALKDWQRSPDLVPLYAPAGRPRG